jgi:PAS domain S-box-containing protein/diguanylate cyclase (GGDEF)-like protein
MPQNIAPHACQGILEDLPTGVYVVDLERRILFWNRWAERISGYLGHEMVGKACMDNLLMHCDENHSARCGDACPLLRAMHDGRIREEHLLLRHKDGQRVPVRVRSTPLRDENGVIVGAVEVFDERRPHAEPQWHAAPKLVSGHFDTATGVLDEPSITGLLRTALRDYARDHVPFGVLAFAVDGLERFRQNFGPRAVDKILHTVATTLVKNLPGGDVVGRWQQDRFLVIVDKCSPAALAPQAGLLRQIASGAAISWWGDRLSVSVTAGAAAADEQDTTDTLLERVELSLAASRGRNSGDDTTECSQ